MSKYIGIHTQQRRNNTKSMILLFLFPCIILGLVWASIYTLIMFDSDFGENYSVSIIETTNYTFLEAAPYVIGLCLIWFLIAYFCNVKMIQFATGSKPLDRRDNKRVYNLVENLCISTNMNMPMINVIEDDSLNAFASGINKKTFTVTLTRGIINKLDDDELEGVIAHELSHIRNNDVRLLIVSIIFVGILSFIVQTLIHVALQSGSSRRDNKSNGHIIIAIVILVFAVIAYGIGILMRFAISRKREYMADAGAAEMTHKPLALASALRKISNNPRIKNIDQEDVAQLFIQHPIAKKRVQLFATHPPIERRIQILEGF